jgi:hypothetical protein
VICPDRRFGELITSCQSPGFRHSPSAPLGGGIGEHALSRSPLLA